MVPMSHDLADFVARVWAHYDAFGRHDLPWRATRDPYRVLVSEVMLQQTQVSRAVPKYEEFLRAFPDVHALASAPLEEVLRVWRGLGYNRRARALKRIAEVIVSEHAGVVPSTFEGLTALPGVGPATAGQVLAFAFDTAVPFIETNIRAVYLHEFFADAEGVPDAAVLPLVEATVDHERPREWFWALLDYGAHLKATVPNPSRRSRHHTKQGRFEGSNRQLRGRLLAELVQTGAPGARRAASGNADGQSERGSQRPEAGRPEAAQAGARLAEAALPEGARSSRARTAAELADAVGFPLERVVSALEALQAEGFCVLEDGRWRIG